MQFKSHPKRTPDIVPLFQALHLHQVRYVLIGSVAASFYGVEVQPGDFDITPASDIGNLQRLITMLRDIEATTDGSAGHWECNADGERTWIDVPLTAEERAVRAASWNPQADDVETLDHLFCTRYGNFDVVPSLAGTYELLMKRAVPMQFVERCVWVAHVDDLLAALTVPRRQKDGSRVQALRRIQHERESGTAQ